MIESENIIMLLNDNYNAVSIQHSNCTYHTKVYKINYAINNNNKFHINME